MVEAAKFGRVGLAYSEVTLFTRSFRRADTWPAPGDALVLAGGELATN